MAEIVEAAHFGKVEEVKAALESGTDVNVKGEDNDTLLHGAASSGSFELVKLLLSKGADANAMDDSGRNALFPAAYRGNLDVFKALVEAGADLKVLSSTGRSPLHEVCYSKESMTVEARCEIVKTFLEGGVDVNQIDKDESKTALLEACTFLMGRAQVPKLLLDAGADFSIADQSGVTPVMKAASKPFPDALELLLKSGADANAPDEEKMTPLHFAVQYPDNVVALLSKGARPNVVNDDGESPLRLASGKGKAASVRALLEAGADPNTADSDGVTPVAEASRGEHYNAVALLLAKGAKPEDVAPSRRNGGTKLHSLAAAGATEACEAILKSMEGKAAHEALEEADDLTRTVLMVARINKRTETVTALRKYLQYSSFAVARVQFEQWTTLLFLIGQLGAFSFASAGPELDTDYTGLGDVLGIVGALDWVPEWNLWIQVWLLIPFLALMNMLLVYSPHRLANKGLKRAVVVVFAWKLLATPFFVPILTTLASVADCTCSNGTCTLDADPSYTCWTFGHVMFVLLTTLSFVGFLASTTRLSRAGGDAKALDTKRDTKFPVKEIFTTKRGIIRFTLYYLGQFILPFAPVAVLTGKLTGLVSLTNMTDSTLPDEIVRERFFTQSEGNGRWQISLVLLRVVLTLNTVFFTNATSGALVATLLVLLAMTLIALFVPVYENKWANGLNAAAHMFILWTQWIVLSGVNSAEWVAYQLYFLYGGLLFLAVLFTHVGIVSVLAKDNKVQSEPVSSSKAAPEPVSPPPPAAPPAAGSSADEPAVPPAVPPPPANPEAEQ